MDNLNGVISDTARFRKFHEIEFTEELYCANLKRLIQQCQYNECQESFTILNSILQVALNLHKELKETLSTWDPERACVPTLFNSKEISVFNIYTQYYGWKENLQRNHQWTNSGIVDVSHSGIVIAESSLWTSYSDREIRKSFERSKERHSRRTS